MPSPWIAAPIGWLRRRDLWLLGSGVVAVLLAIAFVALAWELRDQEHLAFDEPILLALRTDTGQAIGPPWLIRAMIDLSALGSGAITMLVVSVAALCLVVARRWASAALVVASGVGAGLLMETLKALAGRARPTVVHAIDTAGGLSFPSGHTLLATAVYVTLAVIIAQEIRRQRIRVWIVAIGATIALLVGFTRVFIGVHYPTDVLGGWLVGGTWTLLCWAVARLVAHRHLGHRASATPAADA